MLKNATFNHTALKVSNYEVESINTSFSIDTIRYFRNLYPNENIRLLVGADNFLNFTRWHKYREILMMANIIVLSRDNNSGCDNIQGIDNFIEEDICLFNKSKCEKIHFSDKYKSSISSSMIRMSVRENKSIEEYVTPENHKYIKDKGLYK